MRHEYRKLKIWQEARALNIQIYGITSDFPDEEKFGLVSQMRRASVSISSNISEGSSYTTDQNFLRFLDHSLGSLCELESQIYVALDVQYLPENSFENLVELTDKLKRMLIAFMNKLRGNN